MLVAVVAAAAGSAEAGVEGGEAGVERAEGVEAAEIAAGEIARLGDAADQDRRGVGAARAHFKMVDPPVYDMIVSHWYDTIEQAGAFRQYVEALQASSRRFANWSKSFYLYTRQVVIVRDTPQS